MHKSLLLHNYLKILLTAVSELVEIQSFITLVNREERLVFKYTSPSAQSTVISRLKVLLKKACSK